MLSNYSLWIEYALRFSHLVAGIAWIGSSFYFIWLDSSFQAPETPRKNVEGELFMVHGGFYYQVEKRKIFPGELPKTLHWFKWEATLTWITGFLLFIYLYLFNGASLLSTTLPQMQSVFISLGLIVACWFIYDLIWHPKHNLPKSLSTVLSFAFLFGLIYLTTQTFSGRGAFILTGVVLGSLMLLNVWVRILPGQAKMIADAKKGLMPDYSFSAKAKIRSVHNTYFIFPVLFIMLSNHYPTVYSHPQNWLLLIILSISGACLRHAMVTTKPKERLTLIPATLGLIALIILTQAPAQPSGSGSQEPVTYSQVTAVFQNRCNSCHGSQPTDDIFKIAPKGVIFESEEVANQFRDKIYDQVVVTRIMPLGNKTQITEEERQLLARWAKPKN